MTYVISRNTAAVAAYKIKGGCLTGSHPSFIDGL